MTLSTLTNYYTKLDITSLLSNYFLKTETYSQTQINNLLNSYYLKTQTYSQTEINNFLSNYVLTTTLSNYYLKTQTYSQTEINNFLSNYVTSSYLSSNYTTTTSLNSLLSNKLDLSTYNTDQTNLALKFFSPLSTGNLRKNYFEYADLTSTKYIFFSQNGINQYQTINFLDDNILQASKLVNNSIGQTQLDTTFYNKSIYCYENWRDIFTGNISLAALNTPASSGTYYLKAFKNLANLTQISWDLTSNLSANIILPYSVTTNNSGYGSADTANFKLIQNGNPTTSTGIEFTCTNNGDSSYYGSFGFNSSGRHPTTSPNYIQYPNPYTYLYSKRDLYFWCISADGLVNLRIQCLPAITKIYSETEILGNLNCSAIVKSDFIQAYSATNIIKFNNNTNHQFNNITNVNLLYLNELYPAVTFIKCNANLEITNILKTDYIQGYSVANLIKFNNNCDFQNNNIINYNLGYQTMLKTTSGNINFKTVTNNTYVAWGCIANDDVGISMGLYRDNSGVSSVYHTMNKNYSFGTASIILYSINYIAGFSRHTMLSTNMDINMDVNSTIYTNYLRPNSSVINCYNLKMQTNLDMNGYTITNYSGGGGGINTSDSIPVNTGGLNFLKKNNITQSSVQIYGMSGSSFMFENQNGESAGCAANGASDDFTIWTAGDGGSYCNWQDEDSTNSRACYISTSNVLVSVSSQTRKHSIKEKNNNNVLDRFLKLKVKSYGYKYDIKDDDDDKIKQRKINKAKKQQLGLILEELYDVFPNACSFYNNSLDDNLIDDKNIKNKDVTFKNKIKLEEVENISNMGIDYNKILLYLIIAFQEYIKKNDNNNDKTLITRNNLYFNDRLDEIKIRLDNIEYNNLRVDEVYRIKNIINTQDEVYKCINEDIKKVRLDNEILRDKHIEYVESNILINNNLKEKITNLENKINTYEEDIKFLKEENIKFKAALKLLLEKKKV